MKKVYFIIMSLLMSSNASADEQAIINQIQKGSDLLNQRSWQKGIDEFDRAYSMMKGGFTRSSIIESALGEWATPIMNEDGKTVKYDCAISSIIITSLDNDQYKFSYKYKGELEHRSAPILALGKSGFITQYPEEERLDNSGQKQVWGFFILFNDNEFHWRRTDWNTPYGFTSGRQRCEKPLV